MRARFIFGTTLWAATTCSAPAAPSAPPAQAAETVAASAPMGGRAFSPRAICAGAAKAAFGWIYLHGIDPEKPSPQELETQARLSSLGQKLGAGVALMRSDWHCENPDFRAKFCWPRATPDDGAKAISAVVAAAKPCFAAGASFGIIGFSNGGYFVNAAARRCQTTGATWLLGVSAGDEELPPGELPAAAREGCTPLHLMVGQDDRAEFEPTMRLKAALQALGRTVDVETFPGQHDFAAAPLAPFLAANTPKATTSAFSVAERCDLSGPSLGQSRPAASPAACQEQCDVEKGCRAFVHISGWGRCFLKKASGRKSPLRFFAGERTDMGFDAAPDRDYSGKDFRHATEARTEGACQNACAAMPTCQAFALIERTAAGEGDCWLKKTKGHAARKIFTCGVKTD